ncbi:hypothetical protein GGS24DRAFT_481452 [Hypoxylon argillaceum]|nr:hypothetical protein GGS24DRAFT_481452 [Hypoxylon argillaceum]KAI1146876.1 hypothetical protein F4825DRAFT_439356 [Nemania diffusa]
MESLRIHTAINSRYRVFDTLGQLPFSIVFGLCRRSPEDIDPRSIVLQTKHSALDVPYAIAHGLLTLYEQHDGNEPDTEVDVSGQLKSLEADSEDEEYLTLHSPINRTEHWRNAFTIYQYRIDPKSELASMLESGKKYTIRLTSEDLGVKWWTYSDAVQPLNNPKLTAQTSETRKLVNSKPSAGKASFLVASALPYPPKTHMHMKLVQDGSAVFIDITMINTGSQPINVQTRGRQRFLVPWGPFQPEEESEDTRPRIIDSISPTPGSSIRIVDTATGDAVREPKKPGPCGPLYDSRTDPRPELESLVTLIPSQPFVRRVDISELLDGLPNGKYRVLMEPRGVWWCFGSYDEISDEGDYRVAKRLYQTMVPRLVLGTDDVIELQIENGRLVK